MVCSRIAPVLLLALGSLGLGQTTLPASQPATAPADLAPLIASLSSSDFKVREDAQARLIAAGAAATQPVRELASKSPDPEVRQRAVNILDQIDAANLPQPSLVTLHVHKAPAREVYESVFQQVQTKLKTMHGDHLWRRHGQTPVTVDLDKVPFWKAIDTLEAQTGLSIVEWGRDWGLDEADKDQSGPASITGPFKVVADQTFGRGTFRRLIVFVEPKLHVIACARQARIEEAVDAAGEDIRLETLDPFRGRLGEFEDIDSNALVIEMPRLNPARGRAAYLKGTVPIRVAASEQTFEFNDIAKANNVEKKIDGRRFIVNFINPEPGDYSVLVIAFNTAPTPGSQHIRGALLDADGKPLKATGTGSRSSASRIDLDLSFSQGNAGAPAKLVITVPGKIDEMKVPFEFGQRPAAAPAN